MPRLGSPLIFEDGTVQDTAAAGASTPPHGRVHFTSDAAAASSSWSTWTGSTRWTREYDTNNAIDVGTATSSLFTAPRDGLYTFVVQGWWAANATGDRGVRLLVNSVVAGSPRVANELLIDDMQQAVTVAGHDTRMSATTQVRLKAGDTIYPQFWQSSGGNLNNRAPNVAGQISGCVFSYKWESA